MNKIVQYSTIAALGLVLLTGCKKKDPIPTALASAGTYTTSGTVDQGTLTNPIYVSGLSGNISEVQVRFKGSSQYTGDVELYLKSPSGKILQLCQNLNRQTDDINDAYPMIDVTFSDAATVAITDWTLVSTAALVGTYRPEGGTGMGFYPVKGTITNLAGFKGNSPNGTWTLYVSDDANLDVLTFTSWELFLSTVN